MHVHLGNATEAALPALVASGITTVRDMGSPSYETLKQWSLQVLKGERIGPRIFVDFIKVHEHLSRETYFAIAEEARLLGIPFVGHVPAGPDGFAISATEASNAGKNLLNTSMGSRSIHAIRLSPKC